MASKESIFEKIYGTLAGLGFHEAELGSLPSSSPELHKLERIFYKNSLYCRPQYFSSMGFFIEYADNLYEAKNNIYEDGDRFPLHLGEEVILNGIRNELHNAISDSGCSTTPLMAELQIAV